MSLSFIDVGGDGGVQANVKLMTRTIMRIMMAE
jgi:hypothetical protein